MSEDSKLEHEMLQPFEVGVTPLLHHQRLLIWKMP
uniref:Uncharacterized protein n=1 Tax=Anguilla anguilla TaxID=7936 RepID=A0A0E9XQY8_ANGAN